MHKPPHGYPKDYPQRKALKIKGFQRSQTDFNRAKTASIKGSRLRFAWQIKLNSVATLTWSAMTRPCA
jgi:hypothetical protein